MFSVRTIIQSEQPAVCIHNTYIYDLSCLYRVKSDCKCTSENSCAARLLFVCNDSPLLELKKQNKNNNNVNNTTTGSLNDGRQRFSRMVLICKCCCPGNMEELGHCEFNKKKIHNEASVRLCRCNSGPKNTIYPQIFQFISVHVEIPQSGAGYGLLT